MNDYEKLLYKCNRQKNQLRKQKIKILEYKEEIERLNNIINELEKWLREDTETYMMTMETGRAFNMFDILDKLQELKGDGSNEL